VRLISKHIPVVRQRVFELIGYNREVMKKDANIFEILNHSTLKLLEAPSLEKLCKMIVDEGRKLLETDHGSIFLFEKNKLERVYTSSPLLRKSKIKKRGHLEKAFLSGKLVLLQSPQTEKLSKEYKILGIKSVVLLPLSYKSSTIGMLVLHSLKEQYFSNGQLRILKLFASVACLAIIKSRLHEETKRALEIRDRFISLASHELRTPLTSINGYIQLLYGKLANRDTIESRWMEELYNESIRLTNLVKELLDINRIKQGQFAFTLSEVDMKEVVEKVIKQYRSYNPEREIIFEDKIFDNHYRVIGDFDKLREMVAALLSNAVKFSTPSAKIIITLIPTTRSIHMKMKDYGEGIPKDDLENIFDGFYKTQYTQEKEGMGVGLLLAQYVVNYHKGKISITSEKQDGTTVDVELPRLKM
jgi:K+-sensing histidine kinase KdpD